LAVLLVDDLMIVCIDEKTKKYKVHQKVEIAKKYWLVAVCCCGWRIIMMTIKNNNISRFIASS
jgi:hypothetical protein